MTKFKKTQKEISFLKPLIETYIGGVEDERYENYKSTLINLKSNLENSKAFLKETKAAKENLLKDINYCLTTLENRVNKISETQFTLDKMKHDLDHIKSELENYRGKGRDEKYYDFRARLIELSRKLQQLNTEEKEYMQNQIESYLKVLEYRVNARKSLENLSVARPKLHRKNSEGSYDFLGKFDELEVKLANLLDKINECTKMRSLEKLEELESQVLEEYANLELMPIGRHKNLEEKKQRMFKYLIMLNKKIINAKKKLKEDTSKIVSRKLNDIESKLKQFCTDIEHIKFSAVISLREIDQLEEYLYQIGIEIDSIVVNCETDEKYKEDLRKKFSDMIEDVKLIRDMKFGNAFVKKNSSDMKFNYEANDDVTLSSVKSYSSKESINVDISLDKVDNDQNIVEVFPKTDNFEKSSHFENMLVEHNHAQINSFPYNLEETNNFKETNLDELDVNQTNSEQNKLTKDNNNLNSTSIKQEKETNNILEKTKNFKAGWLQLKKDILNKHESEEEFLDEIKEMLREIKNDIFAFFKENRFSEELNENEIIKPHSVIDLSTKSPKCKFVSSEDIRLNGTKLNYSNSPLNVDIAQSNPPPYKLTTHPFETGKSLEELRELKIYKPVYSSQLDLYTRRRNFSNLPEEPKKVVVNTFMNKFPVKKKDLSNENIKDEKIKENNESKENLIDNHKKYLVEEDKQNSIDQNVTEGNKNSNEINISSSFQNRVFVNDGKTLSPLNLSQDFTDSSKNNLNLFFEDTSKQISFDFKTNDSCTSKEDKEKMFEMKSTNPFRNAVTANPFNVLEEDLINFDSEEKPLKNSTVREDENKIQEVEMKKNYNENDEKEQVEINKEKLGKNVNNTKDEWERENDKENRDMLKSKNDSEDEQELKIYKTTEIIESPLNVGEEKIKEAAEKKEIEIMNEAKSRTNEILSELDDVKEKIENFNGYKEDVHYNAIEDFLIGLLIDLENVSYDDNDMESRSYIEDAFEEVKKYLRILDEKSEQQIQISDTEDGGTAL